MAIQEIEGKEIQGTVGGKRGMNSAAEGLMMDIVQSQQYTKPIPSTVRELSSNAMDSQGEKVRALLIKEGKAEVSDFFIERAGELYKDSKWEPDYYDEKYLDKENNIVELKYISRPGTGRCDSFIVRDHGVGIGKKRLEGCLSLGFSTKRNRKDALGSYGLGAKVGLSTGAEFYKLTTVYNGVKYIVKVFNKTFNGTIGVFNFDKEEENVPYVFEDGYIIYGERTDEKNYTEVEVPSLKHHKDDYITAVKTQLLYFKDITFTVVDEEQNTSKEVEFMSETIYNSETLILSKSSSYSKPHVVVVKGGIEDNSTGVCYGNIDFKELELQDLYGDIGIKCPIRQVITDENGNEIVINPGIEVIPSREAVRWTAVTREFIKEQFNKAKDEATALVTEELQETDFLKWIQACKNVKYKFSGSDSVLGRMAKIIDIDSVKPKFSLHSGIEFDTFGMFFIGYKVTSLKRSIDAKGKISVVKEDIESWPTFNSERVVIRLGASDRLKNLVITEDGPVTVIRPILYAKPLDLGGLSTDKDEKSNIDLAAYKQKSLPFFRSSEGIILYEDVEIPENYEKVLLDRENKELERIKEEREPTPAEIRERENRVVAHTLVPSYLRDSSGKIYKNYKVEPKISKIQDYSGNLYYAFQEDEAKIHFAAEILGKTCKENFDNPEIILVKISNQNKKHFKQHKHIDDLFGTHEEIICHNKKVTNIMVDSKIVKWNTGRKISPYLPSLKFLTNFKDIDSEIFETYKEVEAYATVNFKDTGKYSNGYGSSHFLSNFEKFLDSAEKIQEISESSSSLEECIERISKVDIEGFFIKDNTASATVVDRDIMNKLEVLLNYVSPIKELLSSSQNLLCTVELEDSFIWEVKSYIAWKQNK